MNKQMSTLAAIAAASVLPAYQYMPPLPARGESKASFSFRVPTCRHRTKGFTQRPTMSAAVAQ